jgi:hypothetical protein
MTYSHRKPTESGWYWCKLDRNEPGEIVLVFPDVMYVHHPLRARFSCNTVYVSEVTSGLWSERLEEPTLP